MENQQERLFYDSYLDALRDDINACGGPKAVGEWFWPEKSVEARRNCVNDRLNGERRERFTDEQERHIMREARHRRGFCAALAFLCEDTGFERPRALEPEDERAKLQREFIEAANHIGAISEKLERLGLEAAFPGLRAAK